jgi:hypothetical protein
MQKQLFKKEGKKGSLLAELSADTSKARSHGASVIRRGNQD